MVVKQLIVAVEGTTAIGPFWHTIASDYLKDIVRYFCGNESMDRKPSMPQAELSLIVFNARGPYSGCLVQRNGWTSDMELFFQWLSQIPFAGGGFNDAAIAEGLAEALLMFITGNENQNMDGQRHCILVAGSNPYPLPTPVYRPQTPSDYSLSDAEGLAKSFAQYAISLSVICPKKLPKLKAIYHAGKSDPQVADPPEDNNDKNPQFLVLISDNFMEARAALSRSRMLNLTSNQNPVKMEVTPVGTAPISRPPLASVPPGMSQPTQPGMQPVGMSAMQARKRNYVKFWEGKLSGRPKDQQVQLARIVGYRKASKPDTTLSSNWPKTLEIEGYISEIDMSNIFMDLLGWGNTVTFPDVAGYIFRQPTHFDRSASLSGYGSETSTTPAADFRPDSAATKSADAAPTPGMFQTLQAGIARVWEGKLSRRNIQGQPVVIARMKGFLEASDSSGLASNWPETLELVGVVSYDDVKRKQRVTKTD